jgi:hypothetical protein
MTDKVKIIGVVVGLLVSFAFGEYLGRKSDTHTTITTKVDDKTQQDKDTHTKTTITETKDPSGKDTKVTVITQDQDTKTTETKDTSTKTDTVTTSSNKPQYNVSALMAYDIHTLLPTYGISASKQFIGPITIGVFGLTNGTIGLSAGVNF